MPDVEDKIKIVCPNCSTKQFVKAEKAFTKINCESCQVRFTVPKIFGNLILHDLVSNDEFSSTHTGSHLKEGHTCRVRVFNEKLYNSKDATQALKDQIYRLKSASLEGTLKVLSYGFVGDDFFIETEHDNSGSLKSKLINEKVSQKAALEYAISIGENLIEAHSKNIVLGNLKTSNIRCFKNNRTIKFADCGITWTAASILSDEDSDIESFNNLPYIAPETLDKKIANKASDIYNYGCIVYELLSKVSPFEEFTARQAIMDAHREKEPMDVLKRKPDLPGDVGKMVMKMISKDPNDRPSDIKDIVDCFSSNLNHVEEVKVEEIKREFENPSPDQTLKPRPPTEIDLNLLSGDPMGSSSQSDAKIAAFKDDKSDPDITQEKTVADLKSDLDKSLDENKDVNPEVKLQDTEVNMDFEGLEASAHVGEKGSRLMIIALIGFLLIVIAGIAYVFIGSMDDSSDRQQLNNSSKK
jgi:serine/threonine protein kinase